MKVYLNNGEELTDPNASIEVAPEEQGIMLSAFQFNKYPVYVHLSEAEVIKAYTLLKLGDTTKEVEF